MQWKGYGYETARRILGTDFYSGDSQLDHARVLMFHSSTEKESGQVCISFSINDNIYAKITNMFVYGHLCTFNSIV